MTPVRLSAAFLLATTLFAGAAGKGPLPIADVKQTEPVNFDRDLLPFLNDNCLACHCKTTTKGGLNLETPELMLKGGETGPGIVPKKSAESLVLQAAAHLDADLSMPPRENKAKAKDLTPEQLGLLKLWIDQGAKVFPKIERVIQWQPLPENLGSIFAVAVTPDGQFAACTRSNRLFIYHLPSGRLVTNEVAHRDQVNALAFTPDGNLLASGGYREVKLWRRLQDLQKLALADAGTRAVFSADGKLLATTAEDGKVKLWSWPDGKPARTIDTGSGAVVALKFSPDNTKLACAAAGKSLTLWKTADGGQLAKAESPAEIAAITWLADGQQIATGGADNIVRLWSDALAPGKELKGHPGAIVGLQTVAPNRLVSGSADGALKVWEIGKDAPVLQIAHGGPILAFAARPDGQRFASVGADNVTKLWLADGKPGPVLKGNRYLREYADACDRALQVEVGNATYRKGLTAAAEKAITTAQERTKKAGDAIAPKKEEIETKKKALADAQAAKATSDQLVAAAEAELKKGDELLAAADKSAVEAKAAVEALKAVTATEKEALDKAVAEEATRAKDAATAKADRDKREAQRKEAADKAEPITKALTAAETAFKRAESDLAVAESEVQLAKADEPKTVAALADAKAAEEAVEKVRLAANNVVQESLKVATEAEKQPIRAIAFSADNRTLATAGDDQLVHTWSAETGAPFEVFKGHKAAVAAIDFSSTGELLSVAGDKAAIAWNLDPGWKVERTIGTGGAKSPFADRVNALAFSHDGKLLATGGGEPSRGGEIKLWTVATGELARDLPNIHSDTVLGLEFSPDDKFLASGAADKMARLTDLATGKVARTLEGHTHHVLSVAWSPDARTVATAGADSMVKVWDVPTGERRKNIEGYDKEVTAVRFTGPVATPNLLTSSGDNKVRLINPAGGDVRTFSEVTDFMQSVAVTADAKVVVAGGQDGVLRVWNAADGVKLGAYGPEKK